MSPQCQNCGSFVTQDYQRVFTPEGEPGPRVCPFCQDRMRDGAGVREARSDRRSRAVADGGEVDE